MSNTLLIIAPLDNKSHGGQAKFAASLIAHLRDHYEVHHIGIPIKISYRKANYKLDFTTVITFFTVLKRLFLSLIIFFRLTSSLLFRRINIVHIFTPVHRSGFYEKILLLFIANALGKRTILNFRNAFELSYPKWTALEKRVVRLFLNNSDIILCQYSKLGDFLVDNKIVPEGKVRVINNGIEYGELIEPNKKANDGVKVVFIGLIGFKKGIDILINAIDELLKMSRKIKLKVDLYGPIDKDFYFEKFVGNCNSGISEIVNIRGPISGSKKLEVLKSSDIFVLPSRTEGFPNSLLEAMSASLPVVVSDTGAMPEVVGQHKCGFVFKNGDFKDFAEKLRVLIDSKKLRIEMGGFGQQAVLNHYLMPNIIQQFIALYEEILDV